MSASAPSESTTRQYELEIEIAAPCERTWDALLQEINAWWPEDFRMLGEGAHVELDVSPGGRGLVETKQDGSTLHWYAVQCFLPAQFTMYLVGNIAPDFGGPTTSNMKLALEPTASGCVLKVSDAHYGRVNESAMHSLESGWKQVFGESLKGFVEQV